jgi:hypothetical protein
MDIWTDCNVVSGGRGEMAVLPEHFHPFIVIKIAEFIPNSQI